MKEKVLFEVIYHSTINIAEEMSIALRQTAFSPNIRDRRDLSCAILSENGELVAQAENIPVHLGSMAVGTKNAVEYLSKESISLEPSDIIILNDPYIAGTHLNDIMLLAPIYAGEKLIGYIANKAHHVDVGGKVPGSMGGATNLYDEGIVILPTKVVKKGEVDMELIKSLASKVRTPYYLKGDIMAQIAAINTGLKRIGELLEKYGWKTLVESWNWSINYAEKYIRSVISNLPHTTVSAQDYIEAGDELFNIDVSIGIDDRVTVDFSGTHSQVDYPINAVYGVTVSSSLYALKSVLDPDMPMNYGFYNVISIYAPEGSIVNPIKPAPVSLGNVETSQRIVDVILKALADILPGKIPAASHGSMNNVMIGGVYDGVKWAFYETIGGGSGGRPFSDGIDGIHTNMTNTLNTPVEVIEREYPILILEYSLRKDSCGAGKYRGGLGITRKYRLLRGKAKVSIATSRVKTSPWGVKGGKDGEPGYHYVVRSSGEIIRLSNIDNIDIIEGDVIVINTPGGGGYGNPKDRDKIDILNDIMDEKISLEYATKYYNFNLEEPW